MKKSNERKLKVTAASGYKYQLVPQIQLKGIWLRQFGFTEDTLVTVSCEDGKLVIMPRQVPAEEEPPVLMVAEKKGNYCTSR